MPITTLPTPPNKFSDTVQEFTQKADTFLAALPDFGDEANALATEVNGKEASAVSAANTATTKAAEAAASAASALAAPGTSATSTTSLSMSIGSKTLTIQTGKSFVVGMSVKIAVTAEPTRWMAGDITAYNSVTGALTVNVSFINGVPSTFAAWTISISGPGGGGGGLAWETQSGNITALNGRGYAMDTTAGALTVTAIQSPQAGNTFAVGDLTGTFDQSNCTVDFGTDKVHGQAVGTMLLDVKNQRVTFVYMNATVGYIITELEPNGSQWEYMPYAVMHVQHIENQGVGGGSSIAGIQIRKLTTDTNEIVGASRNGNQITLPPGDYKVEGYTSFSGGSGAAFKNRLYNVTSGLYLLEGGGVGAASTLSSPLTGRFTLTSQSVIEVHDYISVGVADVGLGAPASKGPEVYASITFTKIGGNYAPKPVVSAARLQPMAGLNGPYQITGFDITVTGANQITVSKGMCLDTTMQYPIAVTGNTVINLDTTPNKLVHLFAVHVIASNMDTVRAYDSFAAPASDVTIDRFCPIDFWQNNGAGAAKAGYSKDGIHWWSKASESAVTSKVSPPAGCSTAVNLSSYLPDASMVSEVLIGGQSATALQHIKLGVDGTNPLIGFGAYHLDNSDGNIQDWYYKGVSAPKFIPTNGTTIYWGDGVITNNAGTADLRLHAVKLRR